MKNITLMMRKGKTEKKLNGKGNYEMVKNTITIISIPFLAMTEPERQWRTGQRLRFALR